MGRQGRFIAEGEVVLRMLLRQTRHRPASILVAEKRLRKLEPILATAPADTPIYAASQAVLDTIVGFPIHRGILALAERALDPTPQTLLADLPARALVLGLFGIANHDNMGGLFRNAAAFGVSAVLLDPHCCDPMYRKAIRVSVGGVLVTPFARLATEDDPIVLLQRFGFAPFALTPRGETPLSRLHRPERAALLLGAEGPGLAEDVIRRSQGVSIAMSKGFDSLNVATTSGIALHHLALSED